MGSVEGIACLASLAFGFALVFELNPWVFSLLPLPFLPPSHQRSMNEELCGAYLPAGVKPQQDETSNILLGMVEKWF